jgi:MFS superfamily sulfate permease-like transporter
MWALGILLFITIPLAVTWAVMILLGIVHLDSLHWVPALGFWQTFPVVILIGVLGAIFSPSSYKEW